MSLIFLKPLIELNKICHIGGPLGLSFNSYTMKAFSAILILFFIAAALGLRLNVDLF
jgi:hypothetical protein